MASNGGKRPRFYLGTHRPSWLGKVDVPLFVSRRWMPKKLPVARASWALDSGGFTELSDHGHWTIHPRQYVSEVRRFRDEIGLLDFAAPMDWMCEPWIVAKTGKSVRAHQYLTVANYLELRELDSELPFIPVLQGFTLDDYLWCADIYADSGVDLTEGLVGLGTICRRQNMSEAEIVVRRLEQEGISLHGFGVKVTGLDWYGDALTSADSMAWSYRARQRAREGFRDVCGKNTCANCLHFALEWRTDLLERPQQPHQIPMEVAV